jgi:hypothetical protein
MPIVWDTSRVRVFQADGGRRCTVYQRVSPREGSWSVRLSNASEATAIANAKAYDASLVVESDARRIYESRATPEDTYTRTPPHSNDADCAVASRVCTNTACGAYHGEPCGDCERRAFHAADCRQVT